MYGHWIYKRWILVIFLFFLSITLFALKNPTIMLQYPTGGRIRATAYDSEKHRLYVLSEDRFLYALSDSGNIIWRFFMRDPPVSSLTIGNDHTIYIGTGTGKIIAVNPLGKFIWQVGLDGNILGNTLSGHVGTLFAVTSSGYVYAVSHRGIIRYREKLPALPSGAPVMNNRYLLVPCINERLYALDKWGTKKWEFLFSGKLLASLCTDTVFYGGTETGTVVAVSMDGRKLWSTTLQAPVSALVLSFSNVLFCNSGVNILSLNSSGRLRWTVHGKRLLTSLGILGNSIITEDSAGTISYYNFSGRFVGSITIGKPSSAETYTRYGGMAFGSSDWNVYVVGYSDQVVAQYNHHWPLMNGNSEGNRVVLYNPEKIHYNQNNYGSNKYSYLKILADSNRINNLSKVLNSIKKGLSSKEPDNGKSFYIPLLQYIASDCITRPLKEKGSLVNDFPVIRSRADTLLGFYGDFKSQEFLINLLPREWDEYAKKSIITSIGMLGINPENRTVFALSNFYSNNLPEDMNEPYRMTILKTLEEIYQYSGLLGDKGVHLILSVFNDSSSKQAREYALELLNSLKK